MTLKPGGCRIAVEWGYDIHEVILSPEEWSKVKGGHHLQIRSEGYSEEGIQSEYWSFSGGLDGRLVVEYGEDYDQATGFEGLLSEATIDEG